MGSDQVARACPHRKVITLLFDMDGVAANFIEGMISYHRTHGEHPRSQDLGQLTHDEWDSWGKQKEYGMTFDDLFSVCENAHDFWAHLPVYKHFQKFLNHMLRLARERCIAYGYELEVAFCSTPSSCQTSYSGKKHWLEKHEYFGLGSDTELILTDNKWRLAGPSTILIDDNIQNCEAFEEAGGHALLVERPWNKGEDTCVIHSVCIEKVQFCRNTLSEVLQQTITLEPEQYPSEVVHTSAVPEVTPEQAAMGIVNPDAVEPESSAAYGNGMLGDNDEDRKATRVYSGFIRYFPLAIAAVARHSHFGNEKYNPDKPLHWDRGKSPEEMDSLMRHVLEEDWVPMVWRALAHLQKQEEERLGISPPPVPG